MTNAHTPSTVSRISARPAAGVLLAAATILAAGACTLDYKPKSRGELDTVVVMLDTTRAGALDVRSALEETFGRPIPTVPGYEPTYRLLVETVPDEAALNRIKERKNILLVAPIDEMSNPGSLIRSMLPDSLEERVRQDQSFAFPLQDLWARDQYVLLLSAQSPERLAELIREQGVGLSNRLLASELQRREGEVFEKGEQTSLSDSLMGRFGWSVRMQHDYVWTVDTTNFVQFRRILPENDRWMWSWWTDGFSDPGRITPEWINTKRDSLLQEHMKGRRDGSHLVTEYRRPVLTSSVDHPRYLAFETLGTWDMTGDFMGGPFVNFTYYDYETQRLHMVEYGQFAPKIGKRRFVRQFRAMGRTFESASLDMTADAAEGSDDPDPASPAP